MYLHPEVQERACKELDAVVGSGRLPVFADRENLPYVNAIVKETLRWHNVAPLNLPHFNIADDEYQGYFIPAKATIIINAWYVVQELLKNPGPI